MPLCVIRLRWFAQDCHVACASVAHAGVAAATRVCLASARPVTKRVAEPTVSSVTDRAPASAACAFVTTTTRAPPAKSTWYRHQCSKSLTHALFLFHYVLPMVTCFMFQIRVYLVALPKLSDTGVWYSSLFLCKLAHYFE